LIWPVLETIVLFDEFVKFPEIEMTTLLAEFDMPAEHAWPEDIEMLVPLHVWDEAFEKIINAARNSERFTKYLYIVKRFMND
jgi:hypothetical protein